MPRLKIIANIAAVAAAAPVTWGIRGLMRIGACGGNYTPDCPPEATPFVIGLMGGVGIIIGCAYLGGWLGLLAVFPAIGAGAVWYGLESSGGERAGAFVLAAFCFAIGAAPWFYFRFVRARSRRVNRLIDEGVAAIATVTAVEDTFVTVDNNPRVKLALRVEPQDGTAAFDGEKTITASRVDLPYVGRRYPAWFDREDRSTLILGFSLNDTKSPEVRRLFALARELDPGRPGADGQGG